MSKIPVVYVIGPFRAATTWEIEGNIRRAEELGLRVAQAGCMPLIPHANTRFFNGLLTDEFWLEGTKELLRRCDACACVEGWTNSQGSCAEIELALQQSLPIFFAKWPTSNNAHSALSDVATTMKRSLFSFSLYELETWRTNFQNQGEQACKSSK